MKKARLSNFELLRIIAMLMILVGHVDGLALGLPGPGQYWDTADWFKTLIQAWADVGVNLFVMISGYFGIRVSARRVIDYVGMCLFYSVAIYLVWAAFTGSAISLSGLFQSGVLVYKDMSFWFVRYYLLLMLISPMVNAILCALDRRRLNFLMLVLAVIDFYFGWWVGGSINPTGYCLMQFVSMYALGYWLRGIKVSSPSSFVIWISGYLATVTMATYMNMNMAYAYNSPAIVMASLGIFMMFANLRIQSAALNSVATHTFAVYLIHMNRYFWTWLASCVIIPLYDTTSGFMFMLKISVLTLLVYAFCIAVGYVRSLLARYISPVFCKVMPKSIAG